MSNEVTKPSTQELDGFGGFTDEVEGGEGQSRLGANLLGLKLKYLDPIWTDPDEQEVKTLLVVHDIQRKVQKWLDDTRPIETIMLAPKQPWPDIEAMNKVCPETEWREKFGKLQGPWQGEHVVLLFNPDTMVRYWWPSPITTIGSARRHRARRLRGSAARGNRRRAGGRMKDLQLPQRSALRMARRARPASVSASMAVLPQS